MGECKNQTRLKLVGSSCLRSILQALLEDSRVGQGVFRLAGLDPAKVEEAIKVDSSP